MEPPDRFAGGAGTSDVVPLREPKAILRRALLAGVSAGGLLGALVVLPDSFKAQWAPEPDVAYSLTWSALLIALPVGGLVGFMPALLAVVVWEWLLPRGRQRARVAASAAATLTVVATAAVFQLLPSVVLVIVAAAVSFAIAYLSAPVITTRRQQRWTR